MVIIQEILGEFSEFEEVQEVQAAIVVIGEHQEENVPELLSVSLNSAYNKLKHLLFILLIPDIQILNVFEGSQFQQDQP